jgi:uncharacterized protein
MMKLRCPRCGGINVRPSGVADGPASGFFTARYRCEDCRERFGKARKSAWVILAFAGLFPVLAGGLVLDRMGYVDISAHLKGEEKISVGESIARLRQRASEGDAQAAYRLGMAYRQRARADTDRLAVDFLQQAADKGHREASFALSQHYSDGRGVIQDYQQMFRYSAKLAETNHAGAQFMLGNAFRRGMGTPIDNKKAYVWYNLAAANGSIEAMPLRDNLARSMSSVDVLDAQNEARNLVLKLKRGEGAGELLPQFAQKLNAPNIETGVLPVASEGTNKTREAKVQ